MFTLLASKKSQTKVKLKPKEDEELVRLRRMLKREIKIKFSSLLKIYIIDIGSCSACELEIQTLFSPFYNISEVGIEVVYNIEEADILFVTGILTEGMYREFLRVYEALKSPKYLITVGDCPYGTSIFKSPFLIEEIVGESDSPIYNIWGCPPEPRTIFKGILRYLELI